MKKQTTISIDYGELEDLVKKTYGIKEYSFVATEECGNDSSHQFEVKGKKELDLTNACDRWDLEALEEIKAGDVPTYSNHIIFQDLVNRGVLEPGIYIVGVCW